MTGIFLFAPLLAVSLVVYGFLSVVPQDSPLAFVEMAMWWGIVASVARVLRYPFVRTELADAERSAGELPVAKLSRAS